MDGAGLGRVGLVRAGLVIEEPVRQDRSEQSWSGLRAGFRAGCRSGRRTGHREGYVRVQGRPQDRE